MINSFAFQNGEELSIRINFEEQTATLTRSAVSPSREANLWDACGNIPATDKLGRLKALHKIMEIIAIACAMTNRVGQVSITLQRAADSEKAPLTSIKHALTDGPIEPCAAKIAKEMHQVTTLTYRINIK